MNPVLRPENLDEVRDIFREQTAIRIAGEGSGACWLPDGESSILKTEHFHHIVDYRPDDLLVRVGAGFRLDELDEMAAKDGLCLPILRRNGWLGYPGKTVGGLIGLGLPHFGSGSIRDWVTGMQIVTGSGEVVESGANVVKSVAGFDIHRMMVGSRGGYGLITEVALRLYPIRLMPDDRGLPVMGDECWISCIPRSYEYTGGVRSPSREFLWTDSSITIPPNGWGIGLGGKFSGHVDPVVERFRRNLKNVLDPGGVLKEGWLR